jgi:hypothetical protein
MKKPREGPHQHAKGEVAAKVIELGLTGLSAKLAVRFASHGEEGCFNTNAELREVLLKPDGGKFHVESIGRERRRRAREGFWSHTRIVPGRKPNKLAERRSSHGTTLNVVNWAGLFSRRPRLRGERRKVAADLRKVNCQPPRPRHAFVPFVPAPGLVEHMQRTGRDVDRSETPGRDGRDGMTQAELIAAVEQAKRAMDDPGATGPPE